MSLMSFGQAESEPLPEESAPDKGRRYLIILGMVIALILAGGSAAYLVLNSSVSANHGPPGAFTPPIGDSATATPGDGANASTSASAALSASTSASHGAPPSANPTAKPPGGGAGGPGAPGPATYRVASGELCPSVDFTAIHSKIGNGTPGSDHTDNPTSHYTDYMCFGTFAGKVSVRIDAYVFASPADAAASYGGDRSAGGDAIGGVGSDAFGRVGGGGTTFALYALDGNLKFKIFQSNTDGTVPSATLRDVAISTATGTLPHLRA
jgi:hypothetical protein